MKIVNDGWHVKFTDVSIGLNEFGKSEWLYVLNTPILQRCIDVVESDRPLYIRRTVPDGNSHDYVAFYGNCCGFEWEGAWAAERFERVGKSLVQHAIVRALTEKICLAYWRAEQKAINQGERVADPEASLAFEDKIRAALLRKVEWQC